jgi:hypothetical protein
MRVMLDGGRGGGGVNLSLGHAQNLTPVCCLCTPCALSLLSPTPPASCLHHHQFFMQFPVLGIPGIVRFIDVRTQWFDDSVQAAIRDGIKQVRCERQG